ncbi:hypothetical protein N7505_001298 [Penicillium chrysogenum]|uniref:Enoyl reductase (ER) domain-containing protein n=1 Tax=Penicillium chrysogenum TaxID=5076 RepID=A0ABQ8WWA1_PENCH|nr:hypothetical protein N7505_001298 [Penicillium chrysogenum]
MAHRINNAVVIKMINGKGTLKERTVQFPEPRSNQALICVSHVAQNSVDVESLDSGKFDDGSVLGCDFVGEVEKVGNEVSKVKVGDIVGGLICGGENIGLGGYSEYTLADEQLCFKLPPGLAREEAVTTPFGACVAYLGLFSKSCLNVDIKRGPNASVLIWGGSSCVGRFAVQIAAMYKFRVIATCAPSNFDHLKSLGACYVLDYRDEDVVARIRKLAPDLEYAFDTLGPSSNSLIVSQALANGGGNLCTLHLDNLNMLGVAPLSKRTYVSIWKAFLHEHQFSGTDFKPSVEDHELAARLFHSLSDWLKDGKIKPNHPQILTGGLCSVQRGFEMERSGNMSNSKIVYEV